MTPIDIRPADLATVQRILREHVPALEVRAFGSRVAWTARETSDLDLALMTDTPLSIDRTAALRAAFTDSDLPFRVDVVDWASTSEAFRQRILADQLVLRSRAAAPATEDEPAGMTDALLPETWDTMPFTGAFQINPTVPIERGSPPPLHDRRVIAHILGTLDDKIELNRRMDATLEAMARALFQSWFVDFDPVRAKMEGRDTGLPKEVADLFPDRLVDSEQGERPEGWPVVPLPELIDVNPSRSLRRGDIAPYLDMANMPTRSHVPDSVVQRPFSSGTRFANGDALVARTTPCLENGKTAYVDFLRDGETGWGSTEYIVMKSRSPLPGEFAYLLARSGRFREFAIQNMSGTSGRRRVPASALSGFTIPAPPALVAVAFGRAVQVFLRRARAAVDECRVLANCRDALLPKLVSGELPVTGLEPARGRRDDLPVPV